MVEVLHAKRRLTMDYGYYERFQCFRYSQSTTNMPHGFGPVRVFNQYTLVPGAQIDEEFFEYRKLWLINKHGCLLFQTDNHAVNALAGECIELEAPGPQPATLANPSPFEPLELIELQMDGVWNTRDGLPRCRPLFQAQRPDHTFFWTDLGDRPEPSLLGVSAVAVGQEVTLALEPGRAAMVHLLRGHVHLNQQPLNSGDTAFGAPGETLFFDGSQEALVLVVQVSGDPHSLETP